MGYRVINGVLYPVGNFPVSYEGNSKTKNINNNTGTSFSDVLKDTLNKKDTFTISNHAAERLKGVNLSNEDMAKINEGINKAEDKGSKNCLILYKDVALVTSVENRTVITAVEGDRRKENLFTNIDSVLLL